MVKQSLIAWANNTRGNVAMIFGIIVVPVLLVVAFAVDTSREISAGKHLQAAIDAASLAGARAMEDASVSDEEIRQIALNSLTANLQSSHSDMACANAAVTVNRAAGTVRVQSDCTVQTLIGGGLTPDEMSVANAATAQANVTKLDLAMMLDVSGSMGGSKIADLKTAAITAAQTLITPATGDRVRVSFVSYSTAVNAGQYGNLALGRLWNDDADGDGVGKVCVSERTGSAAWNDDEPELGKWVGALATSCPDSSLLPLTNNLTEFETAINSLTAGGWTAGHLGVAWSWYLISPEWADIWPTASEPLDHSEPHTVKAVILMTDGQFNREYISAQGDSNTQAKRMCDEMRDQDVVIYAVAFQAPTSAKNTLKDCAGAESRFFDAGNGQELLDAYAAIASQLSALTLVS
ncbi:MAG: VWA domain-containing protein [Hyphomonadaceae bacterium]|nr:VWA domain-containing protein [Hyphomonadaceae bacterium]